MSAIMSLSSCDIVQMSREEAAPIVTRQMFENSLLMLLDRYRKERMAEEQFVPAIENVLKTLREREQDSA